MTDMSLTRLASLSFAYFVRQELSREATGATAKTNDFKTYEFPYKPFVGTKPIDLYINGEPITYIEVTGAAQHPDLGLAAVLEADVGEMRVYPDSGVVVFGEEREPADVVTADFHFTYVSVPGSTSIDETLVPPIVAIDSDRDDQYPLELGSAKSFVDTTFYVNIYGRSPGQRDDLTDHFLDALNKTCPIWNLNKGFPLGVYTGATNIFDPNEVIGTMDFDDVSVRRNPLKSSDEIEQGRSLVSFVGTYLRK